MCSGPGLTNMNEPDTLRLLSHMKVHLLHSFKVTCFLSFGLELDK